MSSIHILYNHTPAAPLRPHPELCCGVAIFNWTEVVLIPVKVQTSHTDTSSKSRPPKLDLYLNFQLAPDPILKLTVVSALQVPTLICAHTYGAQQTPAPLQLIVANHGCRMQILLLLCVSEAYLKRIWRIWNKFSSMRISQCEIRGSYSQHRHRGASQAGRLSDVLAAQSRRRLCSNRSTLSALGSIPDSSRSTVQSRWMSLASTSRSCSRSAVATTVGLSRAGLSRAGLSRASE